MVEMDDMQDSDDAQESGEDDFEMPAAEDFAVEDELAGAEDDISGADHLNEQLDDSGAEDSGIEEALQAWAEGGHAAADYDEADEIYAVQFDQLDVDSVAKPLPNPGRLDNVMVDVTVELGRKEMSVKALTDLKEQDVIELDKLAGEAFSIRINDRPFAEGEIVVVTDIMAVRITRLETPLGTSGVD